MCKEETFYYFLLLLIPFRFLNLTVISFSSTIKPSLNVALHSRIFLLLCYLLSQSYWKNIVELIFLLFHKYKLLKQILIYLAAVITSHGFITITILSIFILIYYCHSSGISSSVMRYVPLYNLEKTMKIEANTSLSRAMK